MITPWRARTRAQTVQRTPLWLKAQASIWQAACATPATSQPAAAGARRAAPARTKTVLAHRCAKTATLGRIPRRRHQRRASRVCLTQRLTQGATPATTAGATQASRCRPTLVFSVPPEHTRPAPATPRARPVPKTRITHRQAARAQTRAQDVLNTRAPKTRRARQHRRRARVTLGTSPVVRIAKFAKAAFIAKDQVKNNSVAHTQRVLLNQLPSALACATQATSAKMACVLYAPRTIFAQAVPCKRYVRATVQRSETATARTTACVSVAITELHLCTDHNLNIF